MDPDCAPPSTIYFFYRHVEFDEQGYILPPEFFWTPDVTGQRRWSVDETEGYLADFDFSLKVPRWSVQYWEVSWPWYVYDMIRDVQIRYGFDPASNDFAKYLGIPPTQRVEIELSNLRSEARGAFFS